MVTERKAAERRRLKAALKASVHALKLVIDSGATPDPVREIAYDTYKTALKAYRKYIKPRIVR